MRRYLAALVIAAVALAPVAGPFAAAAKAEPAPAMADCHKAAAGKAALDATAPTKSSSHCPDCDKGDGCSQACVAKCFSVTGLVTPAPLTVSFRTGPVAAAVVVKPPSLAHAPPAPPPRS